MLVGQQIGPFLIEKELGSGAMGAVYRGLYTKTGQRVAIKVMLPGMSDNEHSQKRFKHEAEILKKCNHPNIVRLLGVGKHQGSLYYAMEYIEGESLDHVLSRRGRLTWDEVVTLGRQLCAALQHAHQQGVVHRDLKPSNLMVLPNGTLKLTDFGIAKDPNLTQLTSANCTVGTASYMSPEQCRGERVLTHKSDLYSLGIVFYELVTGKKPFVAENVMDMFMAHVQGTCERPSRLVLDIPKPLDTLICQLMEKKPEQRPLDADAVANALERVRENAEAQGSVGLVEARRRTIDRLSGEAPPDDEDREAARALLGARKKRRKKVDKVPFFRSLWFQVVALVGLLAALGLILSLALQPVSEEKLYQRIERLMTSNEPKDRRTALEGPVQEYLRRFGREDSEHVRQVRRWADEVGVQLAEEELEDLKKKVKVIDVSKMDDLSEAGKLALKASQAEDEGDLDEARRIWQNVAQEHEGGAGYWDELGKLRERQYKAVDAMLPSLAGYFEEMRDFRRQPRIEGELERKAFLALRYERFGDLFEAHRRWNALKEDLHKEFTKREWFLLAAKQVRETKKLLKGEEKSAREAKLKAKLDEARKLKKNRELRDAEMICLDIEALYGNQPEFGVEEQVRAAKQLHDEIRPERGEKRK
ncbi:MAG: protein kinase [Planctomycetes bacterium]|nr:protein kinase [Planctomycetota bacterium]